MVTTIKDTVKILPRYFYKNRNEAIIDEINHKYSNKVYILFFKTFIYYFKFQIKECFFFFLIIS